MKVNLVTLDADFEDFMLAEYPGRIIEENYEKQYTEKGSRYLFKGLDYTGLEVQEFLRKCKGRFDFEVRDSKGKIILQSKPMPEHLKFLLESLK